MAELIFDPKHGQEAAEVLVNITNGEAQDVIVEAFQIAKQMGEDNALVEGPKTVFKEFEAWFNDTFVPTATKVKEHFEKHAELAKYINSLQAAKVAGAGDVGQVQEDNYDAASVL